MTTHLSNLLKGKQIRKEWEGYHWSFRFDRDQSGGPSEHPFNDSKAQKASAESSVPKNCYFTCLRELKGTLVSESVT